MTCTVEKVEVPSNNIVTLTKSAVPDLQSLISDLHIYYFVQTQMVPFPVTDAWYLPWRMAFFME